MASRMESTGVRNKIQVSQATADLLTAGGFHKWLTPREDLVHAKGKGTLQTYFVNVISNGSVHSSQSTCTTSDYSFSPVHQNTSSGTDSGVDGEMSGTHHSQQYDELVEVWFPFAFLLIWPHVFVLGGWEVLFLSEKQVNVKPAISGWRISSPVVAKQLYF